jgi:hypothetical protein
LPWQWFLVRLTTLQVFTSSWRRNFGYFGLFDVVESARVIQNLTLTKQQFVDLWEVRFRPGKRPGDLVGQFGIRAASPAAARGRKDLVVVRAPFHGFLKHLYFDYGVSFQMPIELEREAIRVTLVGADAAMSRGLAYLRRSRIAFATLHTGAFSGPRHDLLAALTPHQREALALAHDRGYFDVPAGVTLRALARQLGTSHQAVADTLHRAERRLVAGALAAQGSGAVTK